MQLEEEVEINLDIMKKVKRLNRPILLEDTRGKPIKHISKEESQLMIANLLSHSSYNGRNTP